MSPHRRLTIAILTFQRPQMLRRYLNSLVRQRYLPHQVMVIDNDPGLGAQIIVKKYLRKLPLRYVSQPFQSISLSRNFALNHCQTQYLAFVDDDCQLSPQWSEITQETLSSHPDLDFFQGNSIPSPPANIIAQVLHASHQNWLHQNQKTNYYDPRGLDTRNLILNLASIKKYSLQFDPHLPIFEDIDFGLQLYSHSLKGQYFPSLLVGHSEISSFSAAWKKNYYRGQIKYLLNQKWNNYDHFSPAANLRGFYHLIKHQFYQYSRLSLFQKLIISSFEIAFHLGFRYSQNHRLENTFGAVIILNVADQAANQERAEIVSQYLSHTGFSVKTLNTQKIFDDTINHFSTLLHFPFYFLVYRCLRLLVYRFSLSFLQSYLFFFGLKLRGQILSSYLQKSVGSIILLQYPEDIYLVKPSRPYKIILDLPTLYSEELRLNHNLPSFVVTQIARFEKNIFLLADSCAFHWYSFLELAQSRHLKFKHSFILNWGCSSPKTTAEFCHQPKIIYLGKLNSVWINPSLLENLSSRSPIPLDIYSYEKPQSQFFKNLKTSGFLPSLNSLSSYQFGLITLSRDPLRSQGFSAKHLTYLSFGLPVLCPDWRRDPLLKSAAIYYNEKNLGQQIKKYSQPKLWQQKHQAALKLAKTLRWENNLRPLINEIYSLIH